MAYDFFENELEKDAKAAPSTDASAQALGPQGAGQITGGTMQSTPEQGSGTSSGEYTNLQSYLDANQNSNFGAKVAGRVQGDIDSASKAQDAASNTFKGQVDSNSVTKDQGLIDRAVSDPTSVANDDGQYQSFSKMRDAQYTGPKNLTDDQDLYSQTDLATRKAQEEANLYSSDGGRQTLLDSLYGSSAGRGNYTPGEQKLDQLLIQNDPSSRQAFGEIQKNADGVSQNFQSLQSMLDGYAGQGASKTADARNSARGAVGIDDAGNYTGQGPIAGIMSDAEKTAKDWNDKASTQYTQLNQDLGRGMLSNDELAYTGLTAGTRTYGNAVDDPTKFLNKAQDATAATAATKDQQARVAALSKLASLSNTFLPDADKAGTYDPTKAVSFDKSGFDSAQKVAEAQYQNAIANAPVNQYGVTSGISEGTIKGRNLPDQLDWEKNVIGTMGADSSGSQAYIAQYNNLIDALNKYQDQFGYNKGINVTPTTNKYFGQ